MGFIIVAKGLQAVFFWCEMIWGLVSVSLAWMCIQSWGARGAGIAFFGSYVFHGIMVYGIARRITNFRSTAANNRTGLICTCLIGTVFCAYLTLPHWIALTVGVVSLILSSVYSLRILRQLVPLETLPPPVRACVLRLGI
jgi:PST family polysaccharide transporter